MIFLLILIIISFVFYPEIDNRFFYEMFIGSLFLVTAFANSLRKIHISLGLVYLIHAISAVYIVFYPKYYPIRANLLELIKANGDTLFALVELTLFAALLTNYKKRFFEIVLYVLLLGAVSDSAVIILKTIFRNDPYAMLNNSAADGSFIACMFPALFFKHIRKWEFWFGSMAMPIAIVLTKSSTALGGLGIGLAFLFYQRLQFKPWLLVMIPMTFLFLVFGKYYLGDELLNNNGRGIILEKTMGFFFKYGNPIFGIGTGTFTVWGEAVQKIGQPPGEMIVWPWLHNEPMEILFENGLIGLLSVLFVYIEGLWRLMKAKSPSLPIMAVYGAISLTEMPLRLFITQMLGICLLAEAFKGNECSLKS